MAYAERNLPLSAALIACLGLFGLQAGAVAEEISIPGVEEGSDILRALSIAFGGHGQGKLVLVPPTIGVGGAISDVISGRATFARINRPLLDHEKQAGLIEFPLFDLPIALIAHPGVGRRNLTSSEFEGIRSGYFHNWRQLGGPDLSISLVVHQELASLMVEPSDGRRLAQVARTRDVEELVNRISGAIGMATGTSFASPQAMLTLNQIAFGQPDYPLRGRLGLAYKPDRLTGLAGEFLAFLRSERATRLMLGLGARPVLQ